MASASASQNSQHRCVFVGNIPYDATEEQLIQICEEVGPVVSFRLVIDRETGKPKGYGFCEYKDEETALSARRNLQGYEINGRQLRVDFAENDKGVDRNREQGRGGPGLSSKSDTHKSPVGPPILGDPAIHQPLGVSLASTAASVMAGALGGAQTSSSAIPNGLQGQSGPGNDSLTYYLAKMSRHQLNEVLLEMKALAAHNKPLVQQLMRGYSQLPKALFQAQIMLGLVSPQMLQMVNARQSSISVQQPSFQDDAQNQRSTIPPFSGQISLPAERQGLLFPRVPENVVQNFPHNPLTHPHLQLSLKHSASSAPFQLQMPPLGQNMLQGTMLGISGIPKVPPSAQPLSLSSVPVKLSGLSLPSSKGLSSQMQFPSLQHLRPVGGEHGRHHTQLSFSDANIQNSLLSSPLTSQAGLSSYPVSAGGLCALPNLGVSLAVRTNTASDTSELLGRPPKIPRLDEAMAASRIIRGISHSNSSFSARPPEKPAVQLPPEVESVLLQQVMNLTPEQLSSLPAEQQQQVIELQRAMSSTLLSARQ